MFPILLAALPVEASPATTDAEPTIVVTASREPVEAATSYGSVAVVETYPGEFEALGLPLAADVLRILPGVSVAVSGSKGSQMQVRLRGAEANHSLLFVDGIRFNDPAAGNEPRFELLATDLVDRIEVLRGPGSALWGSEAIGGVLAASTRNPSRSGPSMEALAEYGSLDTARVAAWAGGEAGPVGLSVTASWLSSGGIDSFGAGGERDGFENRSASAKAVFAPHKEIEIGAVGHWIEGESEYDGFDPLTFRRADTLDETRNRIRAVRGWATARRGGWTIRLDGSLLASANRNLLGDAPLNRTFGRRFTTTAQLSKQLGGHRVTAAVEHQDEGFRARDQIYFGATDQDRSREATGLVGEWRAKWHRRVTTEVAVRRDRFSAFADATSISAGATLVPVERVRIAAGYSEGIAQPTFYDLFGFFPGSFTGNPDLRPERSRSWQASLAWGDGTPHLVELSAFTATLEDEIVDVFDPVTFRSTTANATGKSRRRGLEAQAQLRIARGTRLLLNYTYLDAEEQQVAGGTLLREVRRPKHSANAALSGERGRFGWGASLSYVGARTDTDFDVFPAVKVRLDDYVLASARLVWRLSDTIEAFGRIENALDADYQDVVGYNTAGRTVHAGLRLRL